MSKWLRRLLASYLRPAKQMRAQVEEGIRESATLAMALLFGVINLIALVPGLWQRAISRNEPFEGLLGAQIVSSIFFIPLVLFGIAALVHLLCLGFRGKATWGQSRRALVWAALVASPFVLLNGMISEFVPQTTRFGFLIVTGLVFIWQWSANLNEVEFP